MRSSEATVDARSRAKVFEAAEMTFVMAVIAFRTQRRMLPRRPALEWKTISGVTPVAEAPGTATAVHTGPN